MVALRYVRIVFVSCLLIFLVNKFTFRPWAIENSGSDLLVAFAYSLPNFVEAVMGVLLVSGLLTCLRHRNVRFFSRLNDGALYLISALISATYVLSQELGVHNIGGNNVYDFNDILASMLGLVVSTGMLCRFGLTVQPNGE